MTFPYSAQERGGTSVFMIIVLLLAGALVGYLFSGMSGAQAEPGHMFASPPSTDANRVFGVSRLTGEMSVCQFERPQGNVVGITRCFKAGEGAGPQTKGDYALVPTHFSGETGIFRVNRVTGEMSICYVRDVTTPQGASETRVLCTPQAK